VQILYLTVFRIALPPCCRYLRVNMRIVFTAVHDLLLLTTTVWKPAPPKSEGCLMPLNNHPVPVDDEQHPLEIIIHSAEIGPAVDDFHPVRVLTSRGTVEGRLYAVTRPRWGVVLAGEHGSWHGPARDLYPRVGRALRQRSVPTFQVRFREPQVMSECVLDVLSAVAFLESEDVHRIALVGHGFAAAVMIQAAAATATARAVIAMATAAEGTEVADQLAQRCGLLLIHGTNDAIIPAQVAEELYAGAGQPKRLVLCAGAGHDLDEAAAEVHDLVLPWILGHLRSGRQLG
jgi:hypothetical protein